MDSRVYFSREEMFRMNRDRLLERGVTIQEIAEIAYNQQAKYNKNLTMSVCVESVEKILSYRDIFHIVQLSIELDRLAEEKKAKKPDAGDNSQRFRHVRHRRTSRIVDRRQLRRDRTNQFRRY